MALLSTVDPACSKSPLPCFTLPLPPWGVFTEPLTPLLGVLKCSLPGPLHPPQTLQLRSGSHSGVQIPAQFREPGSVPGASDTENKTWSLHVGNQDGTSLCHLSMSQTCISVGIYQCEGFLWASGLAPTGDLVTTWEPFLAAANWAVLPPRPLLSCPQVTPGMSLWLLAMFGGSWFQKESSSWLSSLPS